MTNTINNSIINWWDSRDPDSFFPRVYRYGDDSEEGYLERINLSIEQRTQRECDLVENTLQLTSGATILDCPCGYGRHSLELARRNYHVTGVDLCPQFIREASGQRSYLPQGAICSFIESDMRFLPAAFHGFDACINMFLSFGFFNDDDNLKVLQGFHRVLRPEGKLLIHSDVNPDRVALGHYHDRPHRHLRSGGELLISETYDEKLRSLVGEWSVVRSGAKISRQYIIRIYGHEELTLLLKKVGFVKVDVIFPSAPGQTPGFPPQEVIYLASKGK